MKTRLFLAVLLFAMLACISEPIVATLPTVQPCVQCGRSIMDAIKKQLP